MNIFDFALPHLWSHKPFGFLDFIINFNLLAGLLQPHFVVKNSPHSQVDAKFFVPLQYEERYHKCSFEWKETRERKCIQNF